MEKFIINGGQKVFGKVQISGAKNAALPILAASLLTSEKVNLKNVPNLHDIRIMMQVLKHLGVEIEKQNGLFIFTGPEVKTKEVSEDLMRRMRASNLVMGPLLARFGYVKASYPGGCSIGSRPMNLHLKGFEALGAEIKEKHGYIIAEAKELKGADIHLDLPSVGATENLMMAATLAKGRTLISNVAKEPEIIDLANFLNKMGAKITGAGTHIIEIEGVKELGEVKEHIIISDRVEAGTYIAAAAITKGELLIEGAIAGDLEALISKLKEAGVAITEEGNGLRVKGPNVIKPVDVKTLPYPGFPTDLQPQMMAVLAVAEGTSIISESIFENRFQHVDELHRMGANIKTEGRAAIIKGVPKLSGSSVEATDLRAGAALILASLVADGQTVIDNINHVYRGYENIIEKFKNIGIDIKEG